MCYETVPLMQRLTNCIALLSTDLWMERMIKKGQDTWNLKVISLELAAVQVDPLDELQ